MIDLVGLRKSFGSQKVLDGCTLHIGKGETVVDKDETPFTVDLAKIPTPPNGWSAYQYAKQGDQNFTITSSGGGVTVTAP